MTLPNAIPDRRYDLDWLRIAAFGLLIFYHVGMFYVTWGFHVKSSHAGPAAEPFMLLLNPWRLTLLFIISGSATRFMLDKMKPGSFAASRTLRLLVPLVFCMLVIVPPQTYFEIVEKLNYSGSVGEFYQKYITASGGWEIITPTWNHLWFVVYLWVYTMLAAILVALVPGAIRTRIADGAARWLGGAGLLVWPLAAWLLIYAAFPDHDETHALFDDGPSHLHYLIPFLVGWLLRVRPQLFGAVARWWRVALAIAVVAFGVVAWIMCLWLTGAQPADWGTLPFDIAHLVQGWTTIVALVGIADRYWNRDHPSRTTLAEAVFPFYIIHQTIIVVVGWYLLQAGVAALPSFLVLLVTTTVGCWLFYIIGRNIGWLRPLIGLQRK